MFRSMSERTATIRCKQQLLRPVAPKAAAWTVLVLPAEASATLPTRSMVSVDGPLAGQPFQATLAPDGQGRHWLKVEEALQAAAGVAVGDTVALEIAPLAVEPEPLVPPDLAATLAADPAARATWDDITALARRDWIFRIVSGKKADTRVKRIASACGMLASGKRRACCFDLSGMYSKSPGAPQAAE